MALHSTHTKVQAAHKACKLPQGETAIINIFIVF